MTFVSLLIVLQLGSISIKLYYYKTITPYPSCNGKSEIQIAKSCN